MTSFIALLRAVNVGGTGKLAMRDLQALCMEAGLRDVRTYIASGNVVFTSADSASTLKTSLEARLAAHAGRPIGVLLRSAGEMAAVLAANPFPAAPGNRVTVIFLDVPATQAMLDGAVGQAPTETLRLGTREIYVHYAAGQATSKLRIPAALAGTARNMNTVAKLTEMACA